jgi:hypothetical protein
MTFLKILCNSLGFWQRCWWRFRHYGMWWCWVGAGWSPTFRMNRSPSYSCVTSPSFEKSGAHIDTFPKFSSTEFHVLPLSEPPRRVALGDANKLWIGGNFIHQVPVTRVILDIQYVRQSEVTYSVLCEPYRITTRRHEAEDRFLECEFRCSKNSIFEPYCLHLTL